MRRRIFACQQAETLDKGERFAMVTGLSMPGNACPVLLKMVRNRFMKGEVSLALLTTLLRFLRRNGIPRSRLTGSIRAPQWDAGQASLPSRNRRSMWISKGREHRVLGKNQTRRSSKQRIPNESNRRG